MVNFISLPTIQLKTEDNDAWPKTNYFRSSRLTTLATYDDARKSVTISYDIITAQQ